MIKTILHALRIGASVPNPTPLKWAGAAVAVAIIALNVAQSYGVLDGVSESAIIELVMAVLVLYSQIASTDKIGVLPRRRMSHHETGAFFDRDDFTQRMQSDAVPSNSDASRKRNAAGFPDGPFFDP